MTEDTDSIQSPRKKIAEFARRFNVDLVFRDEIQKNRTFLSLPFISGETAIWQYEIEPEVREDGDIIKINPKLRETIQKAPTL